MKRPKSPWCIPLCRGAPEQSPTNALFTIVYWPNAFRKLLSLYLKNKTMYCYVLMFLKMYIFSWNQWAWGWLQWKWTTPDNCSTWYPNKYHLIPLFGYHQCDETRMWYPNKYRHWELLSCFALDCKPYVFKLFYLTIDNRLKKLYCVCVCVSFHSHIFGIQQILASFIAVRVGRHLWVDTGMISAR